MSSFQDYLRAEKRYSEHTVTAYLKDIQQLQEYVHDVYEQHDLHQIEAKQIRSFLASLVDQSIANRTVNRKLSSIKTYFAFCVRKKMIEKNPAAAIPSLKLSQKLPVSIESNPLEQFLSQLIRNDFSSYRDFLLVYLLYSLGLRRSELINLKDKEIDEVNKMIQIFGKGKKERRIPVTQELIEHVTHYRRLRDEKFNQTELLLVTDKGMKMYPNFVYRKIQNQLSAITKSQKRSPHTLRHSFATHLLNQGADIVSIKELLGHDSLQATQVYTHTNIEELKKIYKKSHPSSKQKS